MIRAAAFAVALLVTSGDDPDALQRLHEWALAVDHHQAGERDAALTSIGAWNYDDLERMRPYIAALAEVPLDQQGVVRKGQVSRRDLAEILRRTRELRARGDIDAFRKHAAILHTDLALLTFVPVVVAPPKPVPRRTRSRATAPGPAVDVISSDGQAGDFLRTNPNWELAMDLLDALPAVPHRDPFVAQWYSTIAAYFAWQDNTADGLRLFGRARRVVADDPDVNYAEACFQERMGSARIQDFAKVTKLPSGRILVGITDAQTHFRRAEALLRKALDVRPDFPAASLRLGHVLAEKKEFEAALAVLAPLAPKLDDRAAYHAHLFAGDSALALGRALDAKASFDRALELYPDSQAARLGLGAAYRYMGDRQAALAAMQPTLGTPPDARNSSDEPWWDYYEGDKEHVQRLLDTLREPFLKALR